LAGEHFYKILQNRDEATGSASVDKIVLFTKSTDEYQGQDYGYPPKVVHGYRCAMQSLSWWYTIITYKEIDFSNSNMPLKLAEKYCHPIKESEIEGMPLVYRYSCSENSYERQY